MSNYWEKRAARRMYEEMKTAEEAAKDIQKLYKRASWYIQTQGQDIFEAFRRQTGLTEEEARRYLKQARTPADMQAVIEFAKQIKDPERRRRILNWLKASATQSRLARLATLQETLDDLIPLLYARELTLHKDVYSKIIQDAYLHRTFDIQQYSGYGKHVTPLDAKRIDKMMRERWLGSNYSSRLWGNTNRLAEAVRDELMVSFLTGRPQLQAWRAIDEEFDKGVNAARRLIRTESCYMANQGHLESYKASGIKKYIYVATLDLRTSKICRSLDGKTFNVADAQPGKNYPPMHPWCRSTTIAWIPDAVLAKMKRDAWNPVTGRRIKVPANMTYNEWYQRYVEVSKRKASGAKTKSTIAYSTIATEPPYKDITAIWKAEKPLDSPDVVDADRYIAPDGTEYIVDGNSVVLDYKPAEKSAAEIVSRESGKRVEMLPRVNEPDNINTPDCKIDGVLYEIKSAEGTGENSIKNAVKRAKKQSNRVILDLRRSPLDDKEIDRQIKDTMTSDHTKFLKELVVIKDDTVIEVLER